MPSNQRTLALQVDNVGFMLDRLGRDCAPLQFLRELTQNSIEAILRNPSGQGQIVWDVDWNLYDLEGVYKLSIIDDGDGMTGAEMVKYINHLSSSGSEQSLQGNFGVGAKIAAATRNPAGLVYTSWRDGEGSMIHLWKDPDSGKYGLRQFELPDGSYDHSAPVDDVLRPDLIEQSGTMAVLLGHRDEDDTMKAPEGAPSPSRWIARYLNTRYFQFPEGIEVRAREGWENPRSDRDRNLLRRLMGQRQYLDEHAAAMGAVELQGATAHWWILRDEQALSQNSGYIASSGHVAALYQNELYEMQTARAGVARLQNFGIYFGYNRVVIYVEPTVDELAITPNTARTHLLVDGEELPWANWAAEFRSKTPEDLRALVEEVAESSQDRDHRQAIRERLKQIRELFKLSRYRPTPRGEYFVDDDADAQGGVPGASGNKRKGKGSGGGRGGRVGEIYALFLSDRSAKRAENLDADRFPEVQWVSVKDGTRAMNFMEDRAGFYSAQTNVLQINADFRAFRDMVDRWCHQYSDVPGAASTVEETVREWFEQTLVETVWGVQALQGAREWTSDDISNALSEEALTAAVMPRYHVDISVKRALGSKLGKLRERAS